MFFSSSFTFLFVGDRRISWASATDTRARFDILSERLSRL